MGTFIRYIVVGFALALVLPRPAPAEERAASELQALQNQLRELRQQLNRLERAQQQTTGAPAQVPVAAQIAPPALAQRPGERELQLERGNILEAVGLPKPEVGGLRFAGFFVGSANYNSHIQMVPEFAGSAPLSSEPRSLDFRFDQFTFGVYKTFASWLSAGAAIEVERHGHRHSHGFAPGFGCTGGGTCVEQFGTEEIETETTLHRFNITGIAPLGNGLALSFGRFDTPFGYERHDDALNFNATTSEVIRFGRPMSMTGFTAAYQFTPWLDVTAWVVNRWENETTEDPLEDNNRDKSFGGRIGFTPLYGAQLLNIGIGGWWGPEQDHNTTNNRWIVDLDLTYTPLARLLFTGEFVYGGETGVSFRARGIPFAAEAVDDKTVNWWGLYALTHYDITRWLGVTFRYGIFNDLDAARTGVDQVLQSFTFTPVVHLSRLIPDLRPMGVTYARTRHPIDWVDVKLEYRLNHCNKTVFSDFAPGVPVTGANHDSHQ